MFFCSKLFRRFQFDPRSSAKARTEFFAQLFYDFREIAVRFVESVSEKDAVTRSSVIDHRREHHAVAVKGRCFLLVFAGEILVNVTTVELVPDLFVIFDKIFERFFSFPVSFGSKDQIFKQH